MQTLKMDNKVVKKRKLESNNVQVVYTDEQLETKNQNIRNVNTLKAESRADRAFRRFLEQCDVQSTEYWLYSTEDLDNYLAKFYLGA